MPPPVQSPHRSVAPGSSLYYALLFLPAAQRRTLADFAALQHDIRAVVDTIDEPNVAQAKLDWWQQEIDRASRDQAQHPLLQALRPQLQASAIDWRLLQALVAGARSDFEQTRFLDFAGLRHHALHAGGIPMEVAARLLGQHEDGTTHYARTLGLGLQLTLFVRDAGRHAAQGRLYMPIDELQRFDVKAQDILQRRDTPGLRELMAFQCARARDTLDQAVALLPQRDRRAQKPGLILARIARALLQEIERADYPVLQQRLALTPLRKLWLAWRVQALG